MYLEVAWSSFSVEPLSHSDLLRAGSRLQMRLSAVCSSDCHATQLYPFWPSEVSTTEGGILMTRLAMLKLHKGLGSARSMRTNVRKVASKQAHGHTRTLFFCFQPSSCCDNTHADGAMACEQGLQSELPIARTYLRMGALFDAPVLRKKYLRVMPASEG